MKKKSKKAKASKEFSIIIPVKELNDYLLESIPIMLNLNHKSFEIIIVPNETPKKNIPYYAKDKRVLIISSGKVSPAIKRDLGAKYAKGKYLAFIDDDAYPEKDWLRIAKKNLTKKNLTKQNVEAVCGPALTPNDDSLLQKISGMYFLSFFGGGNMRFRYASAKKSFFVDDFPTVNLIVEKRSFFQAGGFDNGFWPGEDTKFCMDFVGKGYKIWYDKDLIVYHHRRKIFSEHLRQIKNYGRHRGFFAKRFPSTSFRMTYFAPSVFVAGNILLAIGSIFLADVLKMWIFLLSIYFALITIDSVATTIRSITTRSTITSKTNKHDQITTINLITYLIIIIYLMVTIFLSHITYGWNFIKGFFAKRFKSKLR